MKRVAIIGAGISGLFIANLLKQNPKYQITIYDKNNKISLDEGYGIQLSVNSIKLLNNIGFKELGDNERFTPKKINFYSNNSSNKICELDISKFNSEKYKYTTLKRSSLINFLFRNLADQTKTGYDISNIDPKDEHINISFKNNETKECDYLIISDGVFSKSKSLISNNLPVPKYNDTLAIRGTITKSIQNIDNKNISLFLGPNFHHVIYPVNPSGDLNFIAIMKYHLSPEEQKNYSLFSENSFIDKVMEKIPSKNREFLNYLEELKIFPVFVSKNFCNLKNDKIHFIGDAFFAFPPSFAQGASQSIEGAYELFKNIENNTAEKFLNDRVNKTKMINNRSKFNEFAFHLSNPITIFFRNYFLKRLVKNEKFLESYLGKIYKL